MVLEYKAQVWKSVHASDLGPAYCQFWMPILLDARITRRRCSGCRTSIQLQYSEAWRHRKSPHRTNKACQASLCIHTSSRLLNLKGFNNTELIRWRSKWSAVFLLHECRPRKPVSTVPPHSAEELMRPLLEAIRLIVQPNDAHMYSSGLVSYSAELHISLGPMRVSYYGR